MRREIMGNFNRTCLGVGKLMYDQHKGYSSRRYCLANFNVKH